MAITSIVPYIFLIVFLLSCSAFFSASETALFSLTGFQRKRIESKNPATARLISMLLESPRRTLATILIGNMLVNITASSAATVVFMTLLGDKGVGVSIAVMTLLLLIFGEVTPKTIAIRNSDTISSLFCRPLQIFAKIIWPLRRLLRLAADIILPLFIFKKELKPYVTQEELKALLALSKKEGIIEKEEEEMIRTIFDFGDRRVSEIMTPRVDIIGCDNAEPAAKLIDVMKNSKFTKIPVYEQTIDHIIGVVHAKEFMLNPSDDFKPFIKKPLFIPASERIGDLLLDFQSQKVYMAVVIDEFGGTSGIITLEDILEEIVGEIQDEYDDEEAAIRKETDGSYSISGSTAIRDVKNEMGISLPSGEVTTMNGLLLMLFGRLPRVGEIIRFKNTEFTVIEVKKNMIIKISARIR